MGNEKSLAHTRWNCKYHIVFVAERTGLEPATPCVTGRYSNRLNYRSTEFFYNHRFYDRLTANAGYVKFGHGSAQHVRAGFRLGSHNDMTFGEGTSSRAPLRDSAKHSVRELPVNWWVQPSVIRTFSSRGDMRVGTSTAGSGMTFSPSQNGTSLDLQAGLEARVRENITLGVLR